MPGRGRSSPADPFEDPFGDPVGAGVNSRDDIPDEWDFLTDDVSTPEPAAAQPAHPSRKTIWLAMVVVALATVLMVGFVTTRQTLDHPGTAQQPAPAHPATNSARVTASNDPSHAPAQTALSTLATLAVKGRAASTGYDRAQFGPDWDDVDRNGCDTRNDVLARDLDQVQFRTGTDRCVVEAGNLADPYSGKTIAFIRGYDTSIDVQIDHVVALSNSWQTGSQYWQPNKRLQFANDRLNLLAVAGYLNMQKGDGDAATWLPPNKSYRCEYVARQVAVKAKYGLWVTPPEKSAITRILSTCPSEPIPAG